MKKIILYINNIKFIAYGYSIKNTNPRTLLIKTHIRGQLFNLDYSELNVIRINDDIYNVRYKTMASSTNEEWYFEILE